MYCCFQAPVAGRAALAERWTREPDAGAEALLLEHRAIAGNRKMRLFGSYSAADLVRQRNLAAVADRAAVLADVDTWSVLEIRRVYRPASVKHPLTGKSLRGRDGRTVKDRTRKGDTWRSLRVCAVTATTSAAQLALEWIAEEYDTAVWTGIDKVARVDIRVLPPEVAQWPLTTHEFVLVHGPVEPKQRAGFDDEWDTTRHQEGQRGGGLTPLALAM